MTRHQGDCRFSGCSLNLLTLVLAYKYSYDVTRTVDRCHSYVSDKDALTSMSIKHNNIYSVTFYEMDFFLCMNGYGSHSRRNRNDSWCT